MFSRKTKKSKWNWIVAPLVVGLLGVSCFALWHALSIPSFAANPADATEGIVVTWVSNVTEYLTSLVLYTDDSMSNTAVVLKYDADLNALIIDGAINADALSIWSWNQINGSGNAILWGEKNTIANSNSNYSAIVWWKWNTINWSKLTWSVIVWWEKNALKNVNPNSLIIGWYLNTWDAWGYQIFLWGTWSKNTSSAKYFIVLWAGGSTVSSNSILMWGNIQAAKDSSHIYNNIFVWSDTWTFTPNQSKAFYVNASEGFWLNTNSPKLKLDLKKSGVLYIKQSNQISSSNQVLWLKCGTDVKWTIAYIKNWNSAWLCGCNGDSWVPLSIDPVTQYACAKAGSAWTTNCLWNPLNAIPKTSNWKLRWYPDGNNWSWEWKYPNWTYGGVESWIGGDRECVYTCKVWYAPRTGDTSINWNPVGWFTWSCVQCTEIENRDKWRSAGSWVDDCGFSCKAWYKYDQQSRTCTICSIGEWTKADNQSWSCSRCEMPKGTANVSSNSWTWGILKDGTPYFGNFVSVWTWWNKNNCKFTCWSWFVVSYKNNANNACVQCEVWKYSAWWSLTTCSSCTNWPDPIHYWVKQSKETRQGYIVSTGFFSYTSSSDQNNCDWECNSGYHFKNYWGVCRCSDIYTMHVEWGRCIHNSRYSSCWWINPWENTILWSNVVFQTWGWIWNDFSWNDLPEWSYVSPEDYESQWQSLKNCQWTCPNEDYTVVNTTSERRCIAPPVWKCGSYGGRDDIWKNVNLASVSPNLLCDMSVSTAATTPLYLEKDTNNYDYDEEGNVLRSWLSVEIKWIRSRTCKWYEWKAKYSTLCTAIVKWDKKPWVCDYNPSKSYFDSTSSYQWMCVSTWFVATWHAVIRWTNWINSFLDKWVTWECPWEYWGDWIRCWTCNTDYVFHTGSQLCYSKTRVVNCETWEKPSSWGVWCIYWTWKYTQTLNTEKTTFEYEPIEKWEYISSSVTQNGGWDSTCKFTCNKWYHKYWTTTKTCVQCMKSSSYIQGTYAANIWSDLCTAAEDGYYTTGYAATSQVVCPVGYYCPWGKIIDCPAGYYCPQWSVGPIECWDWKYSSKNSWSSTDCKLISCGYFWSSESTSTPSWGKCSAGTYSVAWSKECSNCSAWTYSSAWVCSCTSCVASSSTVAGTYSPSEGSSSCTTASDWYYAKEDGATQQTICPAGYYCKGGKIKDCPCWYYCPEWSSEPTWCWAWKYSSANSTSSDACGNISAWYYWTNACSPTEYECAAGKYSKAWYSTCYSCSPGTYSSAGASSCTKCAAGTYSLTGSSSCTNCAAGTYSLAGSSSCTNCSAGTYSLGGASSCKTCGGWMWSYEWSHTCAYISCGYSWSGESTSTPSWKKCPAWTYSSTGSASCSNCAAGYYSTNAWSCSCTKCPDWQTSSEWSSSCSSSSSTTTSCSNYSCHWTNHWWGGAWKCAWNSSYSICPSWVSYSGLGGSNSTNFCSILDEICCLDYTSGWSQYYTTARCSHVGS